MLKTNVDRIMELLKKTSSLSVASISKELKIKPDVIQKSAKFLEEEGLLKIEYKFMKPYLNLVKAGNETAKKESVEEDINVDKRLLDNETKDETSDGLPKKEYESLSQEEMDDLAVSEQQHAIPIPDEKPKKEISPSSLPIESKKELQQQMLSHRGVHLKKEEQQKEEEEFRRKLEEQQKEEEELRRKLEEQQKEEEEHLKKEEQQKEEEE
ncbi:MAG: hypothetical protein KKF44_08330, partial [Nanoarchaeota archaeon]|nr:hypothetical protein [Nanoarchaeota archaeon]